MAGRSIPKPPAAGRSIPMVFVGAAAFTLVVWGFSILVDVARTPADSRPQGGLPPFATEHALLGGGWIPIGLYSIWAWRPRRKHAAWHRWIAALLAPLYFSCLFLLLALSLWNALLIWPWDGLTNALIAGVYALSWALPAMSHHVARRLERAHQRLDIALLRWAGPAVLTIAGILGASIGLHRVYDAVWIVSLLAPWLAVGWAQYAAAYLWDTRPWAQGEDE